jgi:cytochrome c oxidase subunit 1
MGVAQLIFIYNFFTSLRSGQAVDRNPWHATTVEWQAPSPPPHGNFEHAPVVYRGPYDYSPHGVAVDFLPQTQEA